MQFCSVNYGVTFPMFAKIDVNGADRHPLYEQLVASADADGVAGDVQWNFEKFLVAGDGTVLRRFRPAVEPLADEVVTAIEAELDR
jgi:glutathione peroxidase